MSDKGEKYPGILGRFPGEEEHVMPRLVERLVDAGVVTPPDNNLIQDIASASGGSATPVPAAAPAPAVAAPAPAPKPVAAAPKPVAAPEPAAAASGAVSAQRQAVAPSKKDVDEALSGVFSSSEDSSLVAAVPGGNPLAERISKRLPPVDGSTAKAAEAHAEDDDADYAGAMRGGDEDLGGDEDEHDDFEVVVEEPSSESVKAPAPAPIAAAKPAPAPAAAPKPAIPEPDEALVGAKFEGRIAPSTLIMTDENIEDLLAGATGPTLADFRSSGLADDWFGDPEFTSGKDAFDKFLVDEDGAPVAAEQAAPAPVAAKAAPAPAPKPAPVVTAAASAAAAQKAEDAADDLLADLGLTSSSAPKPVVVAKSAPVKRYANFNSVPVDELEAVADELLRDVVANLASKGIDAPPKLARRMEDKSAAAGSRRRAVDEEQIVITEQDPVISAPSPRDVESRASIPQPSRDPTASVSPPARRVVPTDSPIDQRAAERKRDVAAIASPEDQFAESIEDAQDIGRRKTLILTREEMEEAGKELVGVSEAPMYRLVLGAAGLVLLVSSLAIYALFVLFTGKA